MMMFILIRFSVRTYTKKEKCRGAVLVVKGDRLEGLVTDRQIATKAIAAGKDPTKARVSEFHHNKVYMRSIY